VLHPVRQSLELGNSFLAFHVVIFNIGKAFSQLLKKGADIFDLVSRAFATFSVVPILNRPQFGAPAWRPNLELSISSFGYRSGIFNIVNAFSQLPKKGAGIFDPVSRAFTTISAVLLRFSSFHLSVGPLLWEQNCTLLFLPHSTLNRFMAEKLWRPF